jgi:branched-chain amino acid transport system substrate-binding protein
MKKYFHARKSVLMAGLCLLVYSATFAQEKAATRSKAEVEAQFKQGVELFNTGRYDEALTIFNDLLQGDYRHHRLTGVLYMRARCAYHLGRYEAAAKTLEELERIFPKSVYVEHGHALLGMMAYQKEEYLEAAVEFLWVIETGQNTALRNQAIEWAKAVLDDYLAIADLRRLRKAYNGPKGTPLVVMALAREEMQLGNRETGEKLIDDFLQANPNTPFRVELEQLRRTGGKPTLSVCRIGIVLPLTGYNSDAGIGVYRGIRYAQLAIGTNGHDHESSNTAKDCAIEFVVRDSESSINRALKVTQDLLNDATVVAIIGEVDNSITAAIAALAETQGIPLLAPVATENGIGGLGKNVFQLNADREHKSRALAEYAFNYLNARTFVTIAPQDDYGQQMTDGFSAAVDSLGGEIIAQKWYYGEPHDLGRHFKAIREAAFRKARKDSLYHDGVRSPVAFRDALENPVINIHAMLLPLYEEDIQLVASQRAYYNIQSIILGGENWYTVGVEKSKELQRYVDGAIFASDYYVDPESNRYKQFRNDFRTRIGATPEKWEIFGYDAATLLLKAIAQGAGNRYQISQMLAKVDGFVGMKGEISLHNPERVNSKVNILQIRGAKVVKLR